MSNVLERCLAPAMDEESDYDEEYEYESGSEDHDAGPSVEAVRKLPPRSAVAAERKHLVAWFNALHELDGWMRDHLPGSHVVWEDEEPASATLVVLMADGAPSAGVMEAKEAFPQLELPSAAS